MGGASAAGIITSSSHQKTVFMVWFPDSHRHSNTQCVCTGLPIRDHHCTSQLTNLAGTAMASNLASRGIILQGVRLETLRGKYYCMCIAIAPQKYIWHIYFCGAINDSLHIVQWCTLTHCCMGYTYLPFGVLKCWCEWMEILVSTVIVCYIKRPPL